MDELRGDDVVVDVADGSPGSIQELKDVVGHFATGVVVVTGIVDGMPAGFTCQSFVSLSLTPALVMVCPARTSTTWPLLRGADTLAVNVLAEHQSALSSAFARSSAAGAATDKFAGIDWRPGPAGAPVLDGGCAWLECRLRDEHDGGDHTIAVAEVLSLGSADLCRPLLFHRAGYGIHSRYLRHQVSLDEGASDWDWDW